MLDCALHTIDVIDVLKAIRIHTAYRSAERLDAGDVFCSFFALFALFTQKHCV